MDILSAVAPLGPAGLAVCILGFVSAGDMIPWHLDGAFNGRSHGYPPATRFRPFMAPKRRSLEA